MPIDGPIRSLYFPDKGVVGSSAELNASGTHVGFSHESSSDAPEAYFLALQGGQPQKVSRANDELAKPALGETKVLRWKSKDGADVEGLLTLPVGFESGKKYPLILNIHGGPEGVFGETFIGRFSVYPIAAFAARGYAVLRPNPRGSSGYGKQFRYANMADWGGKDFEDDMSGVDQVIAMGIADPDHMAVLGWSYGGFMTSWVITHTDRFKAAVVGAGVTDLWSFTGTSDIPGFLPDYFSEGDFRIILQLCRAFADYLREECENADVNSARGGRSACTHESGIRVLPCAEAPGSYDKDGGVSAHSPWTTRAEVHSRHCAAKYGLG